MPAFLTTRAHLDTSRPIWVANCWGVLLVEGRTPTLQPLVLELERAGEVIATAQLPLRLSNVEEMFFQVDLTKVPRGFEESVPALPERTRRCGWRTGAKYRWHPCPSCFAPSKR